MMTRLTRRQEHWTTRKPEMLIFYNATKGGVVTVDQMSSLYNFTRNTRRWPLVIFYSLLCIAGTNGVIIYCKNWNEPMQRRKCLGKLWLELVDDHVKKRAMIDTLPKQLRQKLIKVTNIGVQKEPHRNSKTRSCGSIPGHCNHPNSLKVCSFTVPWATWMYIVQWVHNIGSTLDALNFTNLTSREIH